MNQKYEEILSDYLSMHYDDFRTKYVKPDLDFPSVEQFVNYLEKTNRLDLIVNKSFESDSGQRVFLIKLIKSGRYEVSSEFRGMKIGVRLFDSLRDAVYDKLDREISTLGCGPGR